MPAEQVTTTNVDVLKQQSTEGRRFRRKKQKKVLRTEEDIQDPCEPNITLFSHLRIFQIFGFNLVFVMIGAMGTMAYGVIPIVVQVGFFCKLVSDQV